MAKENQENLTENLETSSDIEYLDDQGGILASWEIPEFLKHRRSKLWYLLFFIAALALLAYSYFSTNPLFAVIIILFIIIFLFSERGEPKKLIFSITPDGLLIQDHLVTWRSIQNFYIVYFPPTIKNLYFQPKNSLRSIINIPLENQNPVEIRQLLLEFLPEDLKKEEIPTSESISRALKL